MPTIACVNGRFLPIAKAKVSVEDRGFQFGDGVYEVVRSYNGRLFRLDAHLERLAQSAAAIRLPLRYSRAQWRRLILRAYGLSKFPEAKVYLQVTRGVAPRDHRFPKGVRPTAVITVRKLDALPEAARRDGVRVITTPDLRWARCDVKSLNLLANVLAREEARAAGVFEAILVRDGHVTEGSVSNVFAVINGAVTTSPTDPSILPGITRAATLELIRREGIPLVERAVGVEELRGADEVFLTGTTVEIVPVVSVDGAAVGKGIPGPVTQRLAQAFAAMVRAECASNAAPARRRVAGRKRMR
ncbi:MAG TPA: D-amino-acid transaminase [Nitrospiria bacterium]|nr:D-amino-acid transaminase [Nitrospiria bacterium]